MLNPLNNLSNVVISSDQRQVTVGQHSVFSNVYPCNFSAFDVLGSRNFFSGKYYWEVDVSGKIAWILGVYSTPSNFDRKKSSGFVFNPNVNHSNAYSRFRPENGYWVIGLQDESEYRAFEDSPTSDPKVLTLYMAAPPRRVGVFLDFEAGTVSFFNVTNQGSLIYKFSKCHFSQTAYPYFNPWNCPVPMTLCPPGSWAPSFPQPLPSSTLSWGSPPAPELTAPFTPPLPCCLPSSELLVTLGICTISDVS